MGNTNSERTDCFFILRFVSQLFVQGVYCQVVQWLEKLVTIVSYSRCPWLSALYIVIDEM